MIYRWFWRCSSDPNAHSSFTVAPAESLKSVKTFRRPADGRKMMRDHPNCWTAQLNTIVKTFSCVCVCVNSTDDRVWHWSSTLSSVTQSPDGAGPSSRCRVSSAAPPSLLAQLTMWFIKTFFTRRQSSFLRWGKERRRFFSAAKCKEQNAQQPREKFPVLTVVFLFNVLKKRREDAQEYWKKSWNMTKIDRFWWKWTQVWLFRTGNDVQTPTCMNIISIHQYIHQ